MSIWTVVMLAIALLVTLPVLTVHAHIFLPAPDIWACLATTVLPRYLLSTAGLVLGVGVGGAYLRGRDRWSSGMFAKTQLATWFGDRFILET